MEHQWITLPIRGTPISIPRNVRFEALKKPHSMPWGTWVTEERRFEARFVDWVRKNQPLFEGNPGKTFTYTEGMDREEPEEKPDRGPNSPPRSFRGVQSSKQSAKAKRKSK